MSFARPVVKQGGLFYGKACRELLIDPETPWAVQFCRPEIIAVVVSMRDAKNQKVHVDG
ncbi:hypothetical protein [Uliginosibacterium flavum]|uniref:Uncharacterized protein n=1 Tax=Uliginosibacterium flavum TaxID=1396831 RepID=A0ABV2TP14_9RHOO